MAQPVLYLTRTRSCHTHLYRIRLYRTQLYMFLKNGSICCCDRRIQYTEWNNNGKRTRRVQISVKGEYDECTNERNRNLREYLTRTKQYYISNLPPWKDVTLLFLSKHIHCIYRAVANINMDTCVAGPILVAKASPVLKVLYSKVYIFCHTLVTTAFFEIWLYEARNGPNSYQIFVTIIAYF